MKNSVISRAPVVAIFLLVLTFVCFSAVPDSAFAGNQKVAVCHYPPDDPTNPQTLFLTEGAVQAHLRHGDTLGECPSGCIHNSSRCDDENLCTSDRCLPDGGCEHLPVSCDDGNPCTLDSCDAATGCVNVPDNGAVCDDGNSCTADDTCVGTICIGQPTPGCCATDSDCDDGDLCTTDRCVAGTCTNTPKDCTVADKCVLGLCDPATGGCTTTPITCNDANACTDDLCDPAIGCYSVPTSSPPQEICGDGIDNDCDGKIDEGVTASPLACSFSVSPGSIYWASYANYSAHIVSMDYTLQNLDADCTLTNVTASGTINTNGVTSINTPLSIGTVTGVGSAGFTIQYSVPAAVFSFSTQLVIVDDSGGQETLCGEGVTLPPPPF